VGFVHERRHIHEIVIANAVTVFPITTLLAVGADDRHVEEWSLLRLILPDLRPEATVGNSLNRFLSASLRGAGRGGEAGVMLTVLAGRGLEPNARQLVGLPTMGRADGCSERRQP
jgi:hypothetical protein